MTALNHNYSNPLFIRPATRTVTFETSVSITGNDDKMLVPDMELKVECSREGDGLWVVDRVWETYWNADDVELFIGGDPVETAIYARVCDMVEADQKAIDEAAYSKGVE